MANEHAELPSIPIAGAKLIGEIAPSRDKLKMLPGVSVGIEVVQHIEGNRPKPFFNAK